MKPAMSKMCWTGLAQAAALLCACLLAVTARAQDNPWGPDVVILDDLQKLYQPVPFSHKEHAQMAEMWNGCQTCHHRTPEQGQNHDAAAPAHLKGAARPDQAQSNTVPACRSCHPIAGAEPDDDDDDKIAIDMPGLKGAYHRQCLNCHREWTGANQCVACHKPLDGADPANHAPTPDDITGRMHPPIQAPPEKAYAARYTPVAGANVLFRHDEHVKRFGLRCVECHRNDTCASCHAPGAQPGQHKPVQKAWNWQQTHEPCMSCHAQHRCEHCHYKAGQEPPKPFTHAATGQQLDDKHKDLNCRDCHRDAAFATEPTCGDATCHPKDPSIALPAHRPGPQVAVTLARKRPDAADSPLRRFPVLMPRANAAGSKLVMRIDMPTRLPWKPAPSANVNTAQAPQDAQVTAPLPRDKRAARPNTATADPADCTSAQCHADLKAYRVVHGPVSQNGCDACHSLSDPEHHRFELVRQGEAMCTYCHTFDGSHMPVVHQPVALGECQGCHNPHGGNDHSLSRADTVPQLCARCHDSVNTQAFLHTPVSQGQCLACHSPHGSLLPDMLDSVGAELCITCHSAFDRTLASATFTHKALEEGCERCHDVHGSNHPLGLTNDLVTLCQSCHEPVQKQMAAATYPHRVATQQRACVTCHTPHGGTQAALMLDHEARVCMTCHDKPVETADGRAVGAVPEVTDPKSFKHAPVAAGECAGCHAPHGAAQPALLVANYERSIYNAYSESAYALCFTCHPAKAMASQRDTENTKFRNGDLNLHHVHVQGPRGRSCDVCHSPHASGSPMVVRDQVHFRTWTFAINFRKSDTGGSCAPGCHLALRYDRDKAVPPPTSLLTAKSDAASVRAEHAAPTYVRFLGRAADGRDLRVPEAQALTVLVFASADAGDFADLVRQLDTAVQKAQHVQIVMVLAQRPAKDPTLPPAWRLVIDDDEALAKLANVRGRPATLVINPDGLQIARLGGAAPSMALKLRSYVESPSPDAAEPGGVVVTGGTDQHQRWRLQNARTLLAQGKPQQAVRMIREALDEDPGSATLQVALIEVLASTPQADEALQRITTLPPTAAPPGRVAVLQAQALITLQRWDEALKLLQTATASPDAPAEAHYLLGQALEHAGRWQDAAKAYRDAAAKGK
jgi:predicted CXXCH cytochrome family protein